MHTQKIQLAIAIQPHCLKHSSVQALAESLKCPAAFIEPTIGASQQLDMFFYFQTIPLQMHMHITSVNSFYRLLANLRFATSAHGRRGSIVSYITHVTAPEPTIFKKQCPTWWKVGAPLLLPGGKFHDAFNAQRNVQAISPIGPAQSSVCSLSDLESS